MKLIISGSVLISMCAVAACSGGGASNTAHNSELLSAAAPSAAGQGGVLASTSECTPTGPLQVWAWGDSTEGENGVCGSAPDAGLELAPTPVSSISAKIVAVAAGGDHSLALDEDGNVWAWGSNDVGQVGVSGPSSQPCPMVVLTGVKGIAAGLVFSVAVKKDGTVWTWGDDLFGELGRPVSDPSLSYDSTPQQVTAISARITDVYAGWRHALAHAATGETWGWGVNYEGQLGAHAGHMYNVDAGAEATGAYVVSPVRITEIPQDATAIATGNYDTYYVEDGAVWAFGDNTYGNLGVPPGSSAIGVPVNVPGLSDVRRVAATFHALALDDDGVVRSWGYNGTGQLGWPAGPSSSTPHAVAAALPPIASLAAADYASFAVDANGRLWAWGDDSIGELGTTAFVNTITPTPVTAIGGVVQVSAAGEHVLALAYACVPVEDAGGPATGTCSGDASVAPALSATLTTILPTQDQNGLSNYLLTDFGEGCLPNPADPLAGAAVGGTPPYSYSWSVTLVAPDGGVSPPIPFATGASTTTAAFPSNWSEDLSYQAMSTGQPVVITLTVTDAAGVTADAQQTVAWACAPD